MTLAVGSVAFMGLAVNWTAAGLLALAIAFYVFVYTVWLKRRTPHNIVIGGAAGAFDQETGVAEIAHPDVAIIGQGYRDDPGISLHHRQALRDRTARAEGEQQPGRESLSTSSEETPEPIHPATSRERRGPILCSATERRRHAAGQWLNASRNQSLNTSIRLTSAVWPSSSGLLSMLIFTGS